MIKGLAALVLSALAALSLLIAPTTSQPELIAQTAPSPTTTIAALPYSRWCAAVPTLDTSMSIARGDRTDGNHYACFLVSNLNQMANQAPLGQLQEMFLMEYPVPRIDRYLKTTEKHPFQPDATPYTVSFGDGVIAALSSNGVGCPDATNIPCRYTFWIVHTYPKAGIYEARFYQGGKPISPKINLIASTTINQ